MAANKERTFIAIKPDGVQRGLIGKIVKRFEERGFKLVALKMCAPGGNCYQFCDTPQWQKPGDIFVTWF